MVKQSETKNSAQVLCVITLFPRGGRCRHLVAVSTHSHVTF